MKQPHASRGMALVEALLASALLGIGVLGAARLILHAQSSLQEARAQAHAHTLASEALDCALSGLPPCPTTLASVYAGVRYNVTLERGTIGPELESLAVVVEWVSEGNTAEAPRRLRWSTRRSSLSGWLGLSSP